MKTCGRTARGAIISNGRAKRGPGALAPGAPRSLEPGRRRRLLPFLIPLLPFLSLLSFFSFLSLLLLWQNRRALAPLAGPEATRRRGVCRFKRGDSAGPRRVGKISSASRPLPASSPFPRRARAPMRARRLDFSPGGSNRVALAHPDRPFGARRPIAGRGKGRRSGRQGGKATCEKEGEKWGWVRGGAGGGEGRRGEKKNAGASPAFPRGPKPRPPRCGRAMAWFFAPPKVRFACGRSRANGFSCPKPSPTPCPPRRAESSPRPGRTAGSMC